MCLSSDILDDKIEQRLSICGVQERFSSMIIPKSFCFETCLILVPSTCRSRCSMGSNLCFALSNIYVVLSRFIGNLLRLLQFIISTKSAEISSLILFLSELLVCTVVSSANKSQ